jgi:hypothetical protein
MLLVVSSVQRVVQCCVISHISRILVCVHSTPWCGSTLSISCIVVQYFALENHTNALAVNLRDSSETTHGLKRYTVLTLPEKN